MQYEVIHGSCLDHMRSMACDSVDAIVTDPPYGLGKIPDATDMLKTWLEGDVFDPGGGGFMNRKWDSFIPGPHYWKEAIRVLKPGGHIVCFAATRTADLMGLALRLAGFEIRDSIEFSYGSGFPKSMNISKEIDRLHGAKREVIGTAENFGASKLEEGKTGFGDYAGEWDITAPATDDAKKWSGWGTALKPAHEPILIARKPPGQTVAVNVLQHGTGGLNIDDTRIAHSSHEDFAAHAAQVQTIKDRGGSMEDSWKNSSDLSGASDVNVKGRWPANLVMQHSADCVRIGTATIKANPTWDTPNRETESTFTGKAVSRVRHADTVTNFAMQAGQPIIQENIPQWKCADDCPVRLMDDQSGEGAARFFAQFEVDEFDLDPFFYCPKPSRAERDMGLGEFRVASGGEATGRQEDSKGTQNPRAGAGRNGGSRNIHPTVKSLQLMRYLCKLVTPKNGIILDPFTGSGATGCAALLEGFRFIGCELNDTDAEPYVRIARARIEYVASGEYLRQSVKKKLPKQVVHVGQQSLF